MENSDLNQNNLSSTLEEKSEINSEKFGKIPEKFEKTSGQLNFNNLTIRSKSTSDTIKKSDKKSEKPSTTLRSLITDPKVLQQIEEVKKHLNSDKTNIFGILRESGRVFKAKRSNPPKYIQKEDVQNLYEKYELNKSKDSS